MPEPRSRNLQLDVLRGLAILLVFGRHLELPVPEGLVGVWADAWYRIGWLGVDLFFVLSGFLIGGLLIKELQHRGSIHIGRFLARRGLKLYPGYVVFIGYLLVVPAAKALASGGDWTGAIRHGWAQYWPNFLFLQNYLGSPAGHTWSLAVEEHFYLLLPFGVAAVSLLGQRPRLMYFCFGLVPLFLCARVVAVLTDDSFAATMAATHLRLDGLLFGVGLRVLAQDRQTTFAALGRSRVVLVIAGVGLWLPNLFLEPSTTLIRTLGLSATFLGSAAFVIAAFHTVSTDFGAAAAYVRPAAGFIAWIGVYSYAIYLWHVTVFGIVTREVAERLIHLLGLTPATWLVAATLISAGAVATGVIATKIIEEPVLRMRDRWFPSTAGSLPATPGHKSPSLETGRELAGMRKEAV